MMWETTFSTLLLVANPRKPPDRYRMAYLLLRAYLRVRVADRNSLLLQLSQYFDLLYISRMFKENTTSLTWALRI